MPNDNQNVIYVWLDALTNYLYDLDFTNNSAQYQQFWQQATPIHIVGKDIIRFHAVYWPAFLMAANINLPHTIYAHGWWTNSGQKISKSHPRMKGKITMFFQSLNENGTRNCHNEVLERKNKFLNIDFGIK